MTIKTYVVDLFGNSSEDLSMIESPDFCHVRIVGTFVCPYCEESIHINMHWVPNINYRGLLLAQHFRCSAALFCIHGQVAKSHGDLISKCKPCLYKHISDVL